MSDDNAPQSKKDDKKQSVGGGPVVSGGSNGRAGGGNARRTQSNAKAPGPPGASSTNTNVKRQPAAATTAADSRSATGGDNRRKEGRTDQRARNQSTGGGRGSAPSSAPGGHRKGQSTANVGQRPPGAQAALPKETSKTTAQITPTQDGGSAAMNSLKRVITDMKSIPSNTASAGHGMTASMSMPLPQNSVNAPSFQPSSTPFPMSAVDAGRHRKAVSLGSNSAQSFSPSFSSPRQYAPNLGSMNEDAEPMSGGYEDGEIVEMPQAQPFPRQQQSGSFTAPRFAALAAQQQADQIDSVGPSGRPQLNPGFTFGGRRPSLTSPLMPSPMVPGITEEDMDFQFPQKQNQQQQYGDDSPVQTSPPNPLGGHVPRRSGPEITGIMAEQIALQTQIEMLQQQQQALLQQQIASSQVMASISTPQMASNARQAAHRRIQSTQVPMGGMNYNNFGSMSNVLAFPLSGNVGLGIDQVGGTNVPRGHGRRHSVNVLNKTPTQSNFPSPFPIQAPFQPESFDDGFMPPQFQGGHSRTGSRVDSTWRINGGAGAIQSNPAFSADLAQAQAQLQSLQQFRAASGGHHQKLPSFSFPNMLPNMMAANMMGMGGGFNLIQQQQQQFQMQLQQQSNQPQRKSLFAPYLPQASLPPLLAAGKLVVGILRVNKRNRSDAYISTEVLDSDIYICGSKDRNRALEGDIVAVELLDVDEVWGTKKEKEDKKRKKEENAAYDVRAVVGRKNDKKKDDVEVEGQGLMLFEDEEVTDEIKPQFAGHVVAVVERMPGQLFSGTLGLLRPSSAATKEKQEAERREREGDRSPEEPKRPPTERPKIVWFKPTDKRVPLIAIPTEQAPPDFVQNSDAYVDRLFVACIKRHPISSLHPFGTLVEELGPIGDVEVETSALLKDCNFPTEEFPDNVLKCLPPTPWTIPEREVETRKDLRAERVFTIDPETAKDLDDALSIRPNDDGTYDVGVHIADVSYFVKPNTPLDRDARKRATSVYLVQRAVPMLPPALCEQLCSLVPGQDRLAFSVIFTLTKDGRVLNKWFGKTVIRSAAKLSYKDAQSALEGKSLGAVAVAPEHDIVDIAHDIKVLWEVARDMRERRQQAGFIHSNSARITFQLDANGAPVDCAPYVRTDAHSLVEEFMLLANITMSQQIAVHLPEQALLRRHEEPTDRRLTAFAERVKRMGYDMDTSSVGALQSSLDAVSDPEAYRLLDILLRKTNRTAKYFCAGMLDIAKYHHYALNVPLYTHFTSPIRRYADILVHRQLESIVQGPSGDPKFTMDRDSVAKVAQQCNIKRESAKLAQEQSAHLFLCLLIADLTTRYGPVVRQANVVGVLDAAFDVLVPEFGIEKRVHVDQMPIDNHVFDEHSHTLQIYWSTRDVISWLAENTDDEHLKKVKRTADHHAVNMEVASASVQDERALFDDDDENEDEIVMDRTKDHTSNAKDESETSKQRIQSARKIVPQSEGLRTTGSGHRIQDIKELMKVPVIVTADLTKSPPVIKVYSVNPYAERRAEAAHS